MTFTPQDFDADVWAEHRRSDPPQHELVEQLLGDVVQIDAVPSEFEQYVLDRIAARPSPAPPPADPLAAIVDKLDEILTLLRRNPQ